MTDVQNVLKGMTYDENNYRLLVQFLKRVVYPEESKDGCQYVIHFDQDCVEWWLDMIRDDIEINDMDPTLYCEWGVKPNTVHLTYDIYNFKKCKNNSSSILIVAGDDLSYDNKDVIHITLKDINSIRFWKYEKDCLKQFLKDV